MALGQRQCGDDSYTVERGMKDLARHLQSLGRYGSTAFLVPVYGSGEFAQAFSRSAAVHGATYLLRRRAKAVVLEEKEEQEEGLQKKVKGIVVGSMSFDGINFPEKEIGAQHVVVPAEAVLSTRPKSQDDNRNPGKTILRRISILRGKLIQMEGGLAEQRHILIIPPGKAGNTNVIYGIVVDESINVAPYSFGDSFTTCVLHLSTVQDEKDSEDVLEKVIESILSQKDMEEMEEMHQFSFNFTEFEKDSNDEMNETIGFHKVYRQSNMTVDHAFDEARRIFEKICPNENFLRLSEEMDQIVKERRVGSEEEDQDGCMLESAMNMVQEQPSSPSEAKQDDL